MKMRLFASAGEGYNSAIGTGGRIWPWGNSEHHQFVEENTDSRSTPMQLESSLILDSVSVGMCVAAIDKDGLLWVCQCSSDDPFCNDIADKYRGRINIEHPDGKKWKSVSAGGCCIAAIDENGVFWAIGKDGFDQRGNTMEVKTDMIVKIRYLAGEKWKLVSAGTDYIVAIAEDGSLWYTESCAEDYTTARLEEGTDWVSVHTGSGHTVAVKRDGSIWSNRGSYLDISVAVRGDGTLWAWKSTETTQGSIGPNKTTCVKIEHPGKRAWKSVSGEGYCTLAIDEDGALWSI